MKLGTLLRRARRTSRGPRMAAALAIAALGLWAADAISGPWFAGTRYRVHVATDKPVYRLGEMVYVRGVVLDALSRTPMQHQTAAQLRVTGPGGKAIASYWMQTADSVAAAAWQIPAHLPGGEYTVAVSMPHSGIPAAKRTFEVRAFRAPRLKHQLEFLRKGLGPGDTAIASLQVERAEGGIPAGAAVTIVATVDGKEAHRSTAKLDGAGRCRAEFQLPKTITRGEGTLACIIRDGGTVETAAKTIPILLQSLQLAAYPEGGDLVHGLECGLYLQARTPWGDPADVTAEIVDDQGAVAATLTTEHEGRGRTAFVPDQGRTYRVRVVKPAGIKTIVNLQAVRPVGVSLRALQRASRAGGPIGVSVAAAEAGDYHVVLSRVDEPHSEVTLKLAAGEAQTIEFHPASKHHGVFRATVYKDGDQPMAERLLFRRGNEALKIEVTPDWPAAVPGQRVQLRVRTTDRYGKAVPAVVGLTVTDDAVLELIETRKQAPRLPQQVFLEADVDRLDDAQIYLKTGPKADAAVDLLLATQGWRRFAYEWPERFMTKHGDKGRRAIARGRAPQLPTGPTGPTGPSSGPTGPTAPSGPSGPMAPGGPTTRPTTPTTSPTGPSSPTRPGGTTGGSPNMGGGAPRAPKAPGSLTSKQKARAAGRPAGMPKRDGGAGPKAPEATPMKPKQPRTSGYSYTPTTYFPTYYPSLPTPTPNPTTPTTPPSTPWAGRWVREYAHRAQRPSGDTHRRDFTETVYWNAALRTNADGQATVSFALSDNITTFRVQADGFDAHGGIGSGDAAITCRRPFFVEPKVPLEVTAGDRILLPVVAVNHSRRRLAVQIAADVPSILQVPKDLDLETLLQPDGRGRLFVPVTVGMANGTAALVLDAKGGTFRDRVTRTINIRPSGFPMAASSAGVLDGAVAHTVVIPEGVAPASVESELQLYPTPLASLTGALQALVRQPHGCFEQTSSTSYPMVMAQQYFTTHQGVDPALVATARAHIATSYKRLVGFQCRSGGFDWYGRDPASETLTAYGILQFSDMAKVHEGVEPAMLNRAITWLLSRRDGTGAFRLGARHGNWNAHPRAANAYILWALTEAGVPDLGTEIDALTQAALEDPDSYFRALLSLACFNTKRTAHARRFAGELVRSQKPEGWVGDARTTVVGSRGRSLQVETTALAIAAWLRAGGHAEPVERAMQWLLKQNRRGRFGTTQATVLALRAIVAYDAARARARRPGNVTVLVDGKSAGVTKFTTDDTGTITLPDIAQRLTPGTHRIELRMQDGSPMPYSVHLSWFSMIPASSESCALQIATRLNRAQVREGEAVEVGVTLRNTTAKDQSMPMAIIGLPGGLEPRHEQLQELVKAGTIAYYEVRGRDVVCYFDQIGAEQQIRFRIDCVAAVPGEYAGDASRAYLYYGDEDKHWVAGLKVAITAR